jgi:CubicO group peptidase (beta-lactamase class C family)
VIQAVDARSGGERAGRRASPARTDFADVSGWGFPADFSLPAVVALSELLPVFGARRTPDEWLRTLASVPMLRQPGEAWLHDTCSDIQGVLLARVSGRPLPVFLAERILEPLGMTDTAFHAAAA